MCSHADSIKWNHFLHYWPFVRGIHWSPVNSSHTGQWRGALMFSLIYAWINSCVNNREAGDLRRYRAHYDVIVMHLSWPSDPIWHNIKKMLVQIIVCGIIKHRGISWAGPNAMGKKTESDKSEYKYEAFNNYRPPYGNKSKIWGHSGKSIFLPLWQ